MMSSKGPDTCALPVAHQEGQRKQEDAFFGTRGRGTFVLVASRARRPSSTVIHHPRTHTHLFHALITRPTDPRCWKEGCQDAQEGGQVHQAHQARGELQVRSPSCVQSGKEALSSEASAHLTTMLQTALPSTEPGQDI